MFIVSKRKSNRSDEQKPEPWLHCKNQSEIVSKRRLFQLQYNNAVGLDTYCILILKFFLMLKLNVFYER